VADRKEKLKITCNKLQEKIWTKKFKKIEGFKENITTQMKHWLAI